jgi:hypothetical protein
MAHATHAMPHAAHAMSHIAHSMRAVESCMGRPEARAVIGAWIIDPGLQIPRQNVEIDIAAGENNADSLPNDIDLPFLNRGIRNSR